jgi:hypothetical protein
MGIDINREEIEKAERLANERLDVTSRGRIQFAGVSEGQAPDLGAFDLVLLVDCLEHAGNPIDMLNLAHSLTRADGVCYFSTVGWYHHAASHLEAVIPIPFVTLFFSDRQILDALRRIMSSPDYRPGMWDSDPPIARWRDVEDLRDRPGEHLNKITVGGVKAAVRACDFARGQVRVAGFSWRGAPFLRCLNGLARIPVIQEVYHSGVFGRLTNSP